jgi:hypothetical protein
MGCIEGGPEAQQFESNPLQEEHADSPPNDEGTDEDHSVKAVHGFLPGKAGGAGSMRNSFE